MTEQTTGYLYLVTVKLPSREEHDTKNKKVGKCIGNTICTDVTGEHHTVVATSQARVDAIRDTGQHITRIEKVRFDMESAS